jgi:hypothetical protein
VPEFRGRRGGFRLDDDWVAPVVCCHAPLRAPQRERYFLTDLCRRVAREGNCHLHCVEGPPQASYFGEVAEEILSADPDAVLFLLLDDATPAEAGSLLGTLAEKPYFHRVGGVWFSEKKEDYSLFPQQFRNYLRRKYRTEEALCAAWGEKELLFSEIELPGQYDGDVFNPQDGGWRWIDCNYARHEARREDLDALCRAVKAVSPELLTGGAESLDGELCQLVIDAETPRRHLLRKRLPLARVDHADSAYAGQGVLRTVTKGGGLCHWNLRSPPCLAWEQALLRESRFFSPLEELTASVAHVTDEENGWHGKLGERLRDAWEGSGCLVDEIRLPEVGQPQLPKYRLYFIDDIVAVSPEGRRKIDSLKRDGNVLVFQHATGYSDWSRLSAENISSLVGIELREAEAGPLTWRYADNSHALLAGTVAGGEVQEAAGRRFVVEDRDAVVLGRYLLDGQAAAAVKSHGDWAAVYLPGEAPLEMRDNLVAYAHVHRLADAPAIVRSDGRFLSVEGGKGSFAGELSFLEETALYDVWDGTVTLPSKSVSFQLERGGMRLWFAGSLAEVRAFAKKVRPLSQK